jgi:sugar phosphate permease
LRRPHRLAEVQPDSPIPCIRGLSAPGFRGKFAALVCGGAVMDNLSFGLTMTVVGVGGTFLTLWILSLVVDLLKKVFPLKAQDEAEKKA